ncbi:MAG: phosphoribosyltransferase [Candidatus Omnitrophica bacterium]|nr:phosphoribosyltransferase [Candidatus Omnitrophota bacterium]
MSTITILSSLGTAFADRKEAGALLAHELEKYSKRRPVILGIPRGGLVIARKIGRALEGEMDLILAHKLGAPFNPELAVGAVVEGGKFFLDEEFLERFSRDHEYQKHIEEEKQAQLDLIKKRAKFYRNILPRIPLKDRIVIVTDDGAARGLTMKAALWAVSKERPNELICALPVAPQDTVEDLARYADEVICLRSPGEFYSIGQFYFSFDQITDPEVSDILKEEAARR